jgi:hypothetical protein
MFDLVGDPFSPRVIAAKRSGERDLIVALLVKRLIHPCSKLATIRVWKTTTLRETLAVQDTDVDEVHAALDWLMARQRPCLVRFLLRAFVIDFSVRSVALR